MKKDLFVFIKHIEDATKSINQFIANLSKEEFMKNEEMFTTISSIQWTWR